MSDGEHALALGGTKQRSVLAILLLNAGIAVSTDRLIDQLWGGRPPDDASTALQQHVSRLRKLLEPATVLVTRAPGYALDLDPEQLDLFRFERLRSEGRRLLDAGDAARATDVLGEALSLWRGEALADLENEPFAREAVIQLDEARLDALEARLDAELALGRHAELVAELRALVRRHPLRERFRGQLMLALYRSGRQADALDAYADARRMLVSELGLEPGPALQRLQQSILAQEEELAPGGTTRKPEPATERAVVSFVRELEALEVVTSVARALTEGTRREQLLVHVATPLALATATTALTAARDALSNEGGRARIAVFSSPTPGEDVVRLALRHDADAIVADVGDDPLEPDVAAILRGAACDAVLAVRGGGAIQPGPVVVPFGGADNDWAALELGAWLARATGPLRLLGSEAAEASGRDASRLLADVSLVLQRATGVVAEPRLAATGEAGIAEAAADAGVLVVGLPDDWRDSHLGPVRSALCAAPPCPLLLVARGVRTGTLSPSVPLSRYPWSELRLVGR